MDVPSHPLTPPAPVGTVPAGRSTRLRRLRAMSWAELACRTRQEAAKTLDRFTPVAQPPALPREIDALRVLRDAAPPRFFAGAADPTMGAAFAARFPGARRDLLLRADALLAKRFDLLGYEGLWFGDPIDWHLDPVSARRAPLVHWSRLDPLDPQMVGDSKVVWELNRHQWVIRLAQAWALSGEPRYAAACVEAFDSWRAANPQGLGINWASSLEVAYRLMSWCWMALLIKDAPVVSATWARTVVAAIDEHATHVSRYLSHYSSPNTHLTGEALGLFHAGAVFPELRGAESWRRIATEVLLKECRRQVLSDGVHFEQSTCYQRYTADTYLAWLLLARRAGITLPREVAEHTERMVEFLLWVRWPDGTLPAIGDADGGELLPLVDRAPDDGRATFAVAAALFGRSDFAWAADGAAPELLWLMGRDGLRAFDALQPAPPADVEASRLFPAGGYAVMRSDWSSRAHQAIVDAGPLGCPASSGHGHADLLSVQCAIFGEPCLVDAGTFCYTPDPHWRNVFRGTAAHSTVRVDGRDQAEPAGPFRWHQRSGARLRSWITTGAADVLDAGHDAYQRLADPVTCQRQVVFVKPDGWLVVDDLHGASSHHVEVAFQFAPGVHLEVGPEGWLRAQTPGGHVLWMHTVASVAVETVIACGQIEPPRGWVSRDYGRREAAPAVVVTAVAPLPFRALTLLVPDAAGSAQPPRIAVQRDARGWPAGATWESSRRSVSIDGGGVAVA